ncbi:MAG: uroporphyrinogen-III synthase [Flavobacterium sp.]|nr:uroporphyrinogen-III synthase [Flavobacterium sp.]
MTKRISILSTKKLLPNQKQELVNANINLIEEDFIETNSKNFELSKVNDNLIFTSQNAVQSILNHPKVGELKPRNVFSVGMKTKELLTENGFNVVAYTGYAADLAEIISLVYSSESFTFFSGNLRRDVLPNALKENEITFNEIEVYETKITSKKIKEKLDGILFFSPSGVESYLKLNTIKNEICFCIGETTAEALENKKIMNIIIADKPSVDYVIQDVIIEFS